MNLMLIATVLVLVVLGAWTIQLSRIQHAAYWERQIRAFEELDRRAAPAEGAILFTGSSSIRFWRTLEQDMAPLTVLNRGFGGCHLAHVTHYAERIVFPYRPRAIVLYAGENDLCWPSRKSAETVFEDFKRFVALVRERLPGTVVYFLSMKRTWLRRGRWPALDRANRLVQEFAAAGNGIVFVDVNTLMLDGQGHPCPEILPWYRIHMTPKGYELWTSIVKPILENA
jgi:lysophospholipase L1-like esterase